MSDAVRGDFERLRARRNRRQGPPAPPAAKPERIVLTPPAPAEADPEHPAAAEPATEPPAAERRRSWLGSVLRRG